MPHRPRDADSLIGMTRANRIASYYAPPDLLHRIQAALDTAGITSEHLTYRDLLAIDQYHIGGVEQTRAMARAARIRESDRVLDIGCAIGGPARVLAAEFGATVYGVDAVPDFVKVAELLTSRCGLTARTRFAIADAPPLPAEPNSCDIVWIQLVLMNIADKQSLFEECARVLRPGGRLAILDVVATATVDKLEFPVLWADHPELSHLLDSTEYADKLHAAGFLMESQEDLTEAAIDWFDEARERHKKASESERALSTAVIIAGEAGRKSANVRRNLAEGRVGVTQVIARYRGA